MQAPSSLGFCAVAADLVMRPPSCLGFCAVAEDLVRRTPLWFRALRSRGAGLRWLASDLREGGSGRVGSPPLSQEAPLSDRLSCKLSLQSLRKKKKKGGCL